MKVGAKVAARPNNPVVKCRISKIEDHLYLGNKQAAIDKDLLLELNIKYIVQLAPMPHNPILESSIGHLKIPIQGGKRTNVAPVLPQAMAFIHMAISSGENILVHCKHGENRSVSVVMAYIMAIRNLNAHEAEAYVKSRRPQIRLKGNTKSILDKIGIENIRNMILA